ncbi:MAG: lactate dehydrogenase [Crenarchaeota archaeon]|nr:MAG: lactate dehydrogenase [Thermoproteota archaeon]
MISIIGSGRVGSALAFLCASNTLDDIVLVNKTESEAIGEAMDISNAIPKNSSITISGTSDFSKIRNSEIVVITASSGTYLKSRTEMIGQQVKMLQEISSEVVKFAPNSKVVVVSNPLDVLTYVFLRESKFPKNKVIGVASSLDSSRFQLLLAEELKANQSEIKDAIVLGEHGDSMVPVFSRAMCKDTPVEDLLSEEQKKSITLKLIGYWKKLRDYKARSVFGIAKNTYDVLESISKDKQISIPASVLLEGQYGISDVCIGIPVKISKNGVDGINEIKLSDFELDSLKKSAKIVKEYL